MKFFRQLINFFKFKAKKTEPFPLPIIHHHPTIKEVINADGDVIWIVKRNGQFKLYRIKRNQLFPPVC